MIKSSQNKSDWYDMGYSVVEKRIEDENCILFTTVNVDHMTIFAL